MFPVNQELMRKVVAGAVEKLGPWCCNTQPWRLQARGLACSLPYAALSKVRAFGHSFHHLPEALSLRDTTQRGHKQRPLLERAQHQSTASFAHDSPHPPLTLTHTKATLPSVDRKCQNRW